MAPSRRSLTEQSLPPRSAEMKHGEKIISALLPLRNLTTSPSLALSSTLLSPSPSREGISRHSMHGFFQKSPRCLHPSVPPCPSTSSLRTDRIMRCRILRQGWSMRCNVRFAQWLSSVHVLGKWNQNQSSRLMYSTLSKPRPSGMNNGATLHIPFSRVWSRSPCIACLRRGSKIPYRGERAHRGLLRKMPAERKYFFPNDLHHRKVFCVY